MAVRDIERRHIFRKTLLDLCGQCGIIQHPKLMGDAIVGGEIIFCRMTIRPVQERLVNEIIRTVRQQHRFCMTAAGREMIDAILLLHRPGELVLFDAALQIIIHRRAADQARLGLTIHDQTVNIIRRRRLLDQDPLLLKTLQIGPGFLVHFRRMIIDF